MSRRGATLRAFVVALVVLVAWPLAATAAPRRVVLDTDFAAGLQGAGFPSDPEDAIATALALNSPRRLDVVGVIATFGNDAMAPSLRQARAMVHGAMRRSDVPVLAGARGPLRAGSRGRRDACLSPGVRWLARELRRAPLTVLALGPLTDVACLRRAFPREALRLREVLVQMGQRPEDEFDFNGRPFLWSLNWSVDPRAGEEVLADRSWPVRVTAAPWRIAVATGLSAAQLDRIGGERPEGRWLRRAMRSWRPFWTAVSGDPGTRIWDSNLVYFLLRPREYRVRSVGWRVVSCRDPATGRNTNPRCPGHSPQQLATRDVEPSQLWLARGPGQRRRPGLRILEDFARPGSQRRFRRTVTALRG